MKEFQVVIERNGKDARFRFNHYVKAPCPYNARKMVGLKIVEAGPEELTIVGVREMRDKATAHNYGSIFANGARWVA